ncbi:MAG: hypothetical protein R3Y40_08405, partial [Eubacteriales bacterium]
TMDVAGTQAQLDELNIQMEGLVEDKALIDEYVEESLYMNIDYMNIVNTMFTVHMTPLYQINPDAAAVTNPVSDLVNMYNSGVKNMDLYQEISDALGYSTNYTDQVFVTQPDAGAGFINFIMQSNSQEDNEIVAEIIINYLEEVYDEMNTTVYVHELTIGELISTNITSDTINSHQTAKLSEQNTAAKDISELQEKIEAAQQVLADQSNTVKQILSVIIFLIIGIILGGGGTIFLLLIMPLICNRIQGGRYIEEEYDLTVLATKPLYKEGKNAIDKLLFKWSGKGAIRTEEDFLTYLVQSINVCTEEGEVVHLTGTISEQEIQEISTQLQEKVHANLSCGGNISGELNSLANLDKADSVILVEGAFKTMDRALEREIYHINKLNKNIKGVVLL